MKDLSLLLATVAVAAVASAGTRWFVHSNASNASDGAPVGPTTGDESARLRERVQALEARQVELERLLAQAGEAQASAPAADAREVERAVARWLDEHAAELGAAGGAAPSAESGDAADELAQADIEDVLDLLLDLSLRGDERQALWARLAAAGRLDEVVAALQSQIALEPQNPDLRVHLGNAYLQKLFAAGGGPAAGELAMKADAAFDEALALDDRHWEARFTKAVALSNWPSFLGKQTEAIHQLEVLIGQQEATSSKPHFASSYLILGNMYLETGDTQRALATWRSGLERFPAADDLRKQIALVEKEGR